MVENQFSLGDLVAHKHYPGIAIGHITQTYASGRVGVDDGIRTRSFLPKNLVLVAETQISKELAKEITGSENTHRGWAEARAAEAAAEAAAKAAAIEKETNELIEELEKKLAASQTEVMELPSIPPTPPVPPAQEELTEHSENCSQCGSQDIRRFHYHDPNEYYFYCRDCGNEGWRHEKLPPAQVEVEELEEVEDAIATSEVMEIPPLEAEELDAMATPAEGIAKPTEVIDTQSEVIDKVEAIDTESEAIAHSQACPECNSYDVSKDNLFSYYWCGNCHHVWETEVEEVDAIDTQSEARELPPIPRDFSELDELPEWWERAILPDFRECNCGEPYDNDDEEEWWELVEPDYFNAKYRSWKLLIDEGYQIYATPPQGDRLYHCECELDLDGPCGQVAIAQEFIDSWYFAQPSPGQLSLNIPETVARDPPPHFQ